MNRYYAPTKTAVAAAAASLFARILILDIETAPVTASVWRLWKENVGVNQIKRDWFILSFAAKWLGSSTVIYHDQSKAENIEDDSGLLGKLHDLLDRADIVVAHNGRRFDVKKINARFIKQGFPPPSPYKIVDTLDIAKAKFGFTSNKLEYLARFLDCDHTKQLHAKYPGFALWTGVLAGEKAAWAEMRIYNEHDVLSLEDVYLKLRIWDDKHPNVAAFMRTQDETRRCPICGGAELQKRGFYTTTAGKYQRYRCDCGAWSRDRSNLNTKERRQALLSKQA